MTESQEPADLPFATSDVPVTVLLLRDAIDYRGMHVVIGVDDGHQRTVFEGAGWEPTRPIAGILGLGGFSGAAPGGGQVVEVPEGTPLVPLRSFTVDPGKLGDVQMMIRLALTGRLGGLAPIVWEQAFWHASQVAFEYVWTAAGCPPIKVYHPELVGGPPASADAAAALHPSARQNTTLAAVDAREGHGADEAS